MMEQTAHFRRADWWDAWTRSGYWSQLPSYIGRAIRENLPGGDGESCAITKAVGVVRRVSRFDALRTKL